MKMRYWYVLWLACWANCLLGQRVVSVPLANHVGEIQADLYGSGVRGVVLAHGGGLPKESWRKQALVLADSGLVVLAINFRGDRLTPQGAFGSYGSDAENAEDVLAAVAYLRRQGATTVSAAGGSLGGDAVGEADSESPGALSRIVLLGSSGGPAPEKLNGRKLFIVARQDGSDSGHRLPEIYRHYAQAARPKKLVVLDGSAHAQHLFETDQGTRALNEMVAFLRAP